MGAAVLLALARAAGQRLPRDGGTWGRLVVAALFRNALPFALFSCGRCSSASAAGRGCRRCGSPG
ncbi:hypothetical protein [Amycolatopsis sacchari]|uniref:hypothetical protein n=1 Tax=Amycolatopsis sacchari TaxID=115433 RepID=UPI003EB72150